MSVLGPNDPRNKVIDKARREGRLVRVIMDPKTGRVRPITKAEADKADAKMKPLLDFLDSLPK